MDVERRLREKSGGIVLKPHCGSGRVTLLPGRVGSGPKIWTRVQLWSDVADESVEVVTFSVSTRFHRCHPVAAVRALYCGGKHRETAPGFIHRTAFHGIRNLLKLLEKTYDQFRCPCFSLRHYTKLITCVTGRLYTSRCCSLYPTSKVRAFIEVPAFSGPAF